jgi:hypothetical protein
MQHEGVFRPNLEVSLSLNNQRLDVLNRESGSEECITLGPDSADEVLARASQLLTASLKPVAPRPADAGSTEPPATDDLFTEALPDAAQADAVVPSSVLAQVAPLAESDIAAGTSPFSEPGSVADAGGAEAAEPGEPPPVVAAAEDQAIPELFTRATPLEAILGVFARLAQSTGIAIQETLLSLPPVFEDRRFEILPFEDHAVESVLELRSDVFSGFYLAHLHPDEVLLVYASRGRHIEFGPRRCELQPASSAETDEFHGAGLLGLAQDGEGNFVFIVTPDYQAWAQARARVYLEASARFLTPAELLAAEGELVPIWPDFEIEHLAES